MSSQARWVDKIRLEHSNLLAALRWAESHALDKFQFLSANLSWFWGRSNDYTMAIEILERVMNSNPDHRETQARLNTGYGSLLATTGDFEKAQYLLEQGLSIWRDLKNKKEEALMLAALSDLLFGAGDNGAGMKYANEAYALAKELNDPAVELTCLTFVGFGLVCLKKTGEARPIVRKALKMAEDLENLYLLCATHHMLGDCALMDGEYEVSEKEYGEGLKTTLKSGDTAYTNVEMCGVAMSVAGQGRYAKALRINAAATRSAQSFGSWIPEDIPLVFWHELAVQLLAGTRENLGDELTQKYEEEGRTMNFEEAVDYTLDFNRD
jgi:tetratricopeptide (TPR) repeat protein